MTTTIRQQDLIDSIAGALQYISYYHPADYIAHLARAYEREQSPAAKDAMAQILTNSKMSATGHRRSEEHTSELQSPCNLVCRLLLEKKKKNDSRSNEQPYQLYTRLVLEVRLCTAI